MNPGPVSSAEILLLLALCAVCFVAWLFRKGADHAQQEPPTPQIKPDPCHGCGSTPQRLVRVDGYEGRWCQECVFVGAHHRTKAS